MGVGAGGSSRGGSSGRGGEGGASTDRDRNRGFGNFGRGLGVDVSYGAQGARFGGSSIGFSIDRGLSVENDRPDKSDQADSFFARQRLRSEGVDLSGFRPGANPELGPSTDINRQEQARAVERVHGSMVAAFARGDISTGLELFARNVGEQLGVTEEIAVDEQGIYGTRGSFQPVSLLGNLVFGQGLGAAVAAGKFFGPATGAQVALNALGQRETITQAGGLLPSVDLGYRPSTGRQRRALATRAEGGELTAADQLALDYADRRQASIDAAQRQREQRSERPTPDLVKALPVAATPTARTPQPPRGPSPFGLLSGRDPRAGPDLLRTSAEAAVAAGLARPRSRVLGVGSVPQPGALL